MERGLIRQSAEQAVQKVASALQVPPDAITHKETK
jgi:hypothetical protein